MNPLSPGIRRWLEQLAREGVSRRPKTNVGYRAMQSGLTDWIVEGPGGERQTWKAWNELHPPSEERAALYDLWPIVGEALTDKGREALGVPSREDLRATIIAAASDLVALWKCQRVADLPRAERNAAIEETRGRLIQAVENLSHVQEPNASDAKEPPVTQGRDEARQEG